MESVDALEIPFKSGLTIDCDLHRKSGSGKLIILCHGYNDSKDEPVIKKISQLLSKKYNVVRFSFTDRSDPDLENEKDNIIAVIQRFRNSFDEIVLVGASLGGLSVALSLNFGIKADKVILINPFVDFFGNVAWKFRLKLMSMLLAYPFVSKIRRNIDFYFKNIKLSDIKIPVLFIIAERDQIVSPMHGINLCRRMNAKNKKLIIDGKIDHGFSREEYRKIIVNYITNWVN